MANHTQLRQWTNFSSLHSTTSLEPISGSSGRTSSLEKVPNTFSSHHNANSNLTNSIPKTQSENPKHMKPVVTFSPSKLNFNRIEPKKLVEEQPKSVPVNMIPNQGTLHQYHEKQVTTVVAYEMKGKSVHNKDLDSISSGIKVMTIAGENEGAYMKMIQSQKKTKKVSKMGNPMSFVYTNSNVQSVNNSVLLKTSCEFHQPGVHLIP